MRKIMLDFEVIDKGLPARNSAKDTAREFVELWNEEESTSGDALGHIYTLTRPHLDKARPG
jgi:hypothetical protein